MISRIAMATAFVALIPASMPDAFAADLTGQASIIDGDTLEIHGTRIRLWGIDAPESKSALPGRRQLAVSVRREGSERSRRPHCETAGDMHSYLAGPIRATGGLMFGCRD
jgi:endonuclease YncB( thermonuclease family)